MKTTTFKLFVTIFTLAAITTITSVPTQAQRRGNQRDTERREAPERKPRKDVKTKSASKTYRQSTPGRSENSVRSTRKTSTSRNSTGIRSNQRKYSDNSRARQQNVNRKSSSNKTYSSGRASSRSSQNAYRNNGSGSRDAKQGNLRAHSNKHKSGPAVSDGRRTTGTTGTKALRYYNVDRKDKRYTPNSNYRGSNKKWSSNYRSKAMNHNHRDRKYYSTYNFRKKSHWDRRWEHYRWTHNSWRDYYQGYHPYSYRYHKHYYYNNHYGHVIRKFVYRPVRFVHNHQNYYCYDGHFFRYRRGVGYILVNLPFGFTFERLPYNYEQVYINGYVYFRVGNLFFESSAYGFQLVHFPDRYYAYNDNYHNHQYIDEYYYEQY